MINDLPMTVSYNERQSSAVLNSSLGRWVLEVGECKESGSYRYCFLTFDDSERVVYRSGVEYPALQIRVEELAPELKITRSISSSTIDLGDRAEIMVTIENRGDKPAFGIVYEDRMPQGIVVIQASGAQRYPQFVRWEGTLSPHKTVTFKYIVEARGFVDDELRADIHYSDGEQQHTVEIDPLVLQVTLPFSFEQELTPEDLVVNTEILYRMTIQNDLHQPLHIDEFIRAIISEHIFEIGIVISRLFAN